MISSGYESDLERDETYRQQQKSAEAISLLQACNRACEADDLGQESFVHANAWMDQYRKGVVTRCASHTPSAVLDGTLGCSTVKVNNLFAGGFHITVYTF